MGMTVFLHSQREENARQPEKIVQLSKICNYGKEKRG